MYCLGWRVSGLAGRHFIMTQKEKFKIAETKLRVFIRDDYICQNCFGYIYQYGTPQLAHVLPATKSNIKKYGKDYIHSDDNLKSACCLYCNGRLMKNDKG
jgi:5-methylcytosine-specific restriction endonuclease McrA